jgi:uncharacterized protein
MAAPPFGDDDSGLSARLTLPASPTDPWRHGWTAAGTTLSSPYACCWRRISVSHLNGMMEPLDPIRVRVLGSLIEKEFTTPDNYPLTLNALTAACNQTSNRDPVLSLDEGDVAAALAELIRAGLAREVYRSDSRAKRYRHTVVESLNLHAPELAILCVLLLRGAQTAGELRTRTGRMFAFRDLAHVDVTIESLRTLSTPLAAELPRRPGQKETRYAHLLAGEPQDVAEAPPRTPPEAQDDARVAALEETVHALRTELAELRAQFDGFRQQFL